MRSFSGEVGNGAGKDERRGGEETVMSAFLEENRNIFATGLLIYFLRRGNGEARV